MQTDRVTKTSSFVLHRELPRTTRRAHRPKPGAGAKVRTAQAPHDRGSRRQDLHDLSSTSAPTRVQPSARDPFTGSMQGEVDALDHMLLAGACALDGLVWRPQGEAKARWAASATRAF